MSNVSRWAGPLVDRLTELADPVSPDRAVLAHLRRGLGGQPDYTLARVGWLFRTVRDSADDRELDSAVLAAGLFAWVNGNCRQDDGANFGRAFGYGLNEDDKKKREKRFTDLLDTDRAELPYKLRQTLTLIARDKIGLDWVRLIHDLIHWDDADRRVQKDWARGFWSHPRIDSETADEPVIAT
ncbi:MAG: CRISPR-associated protein Cse2 family [Gemmataceae bacterium]|nr:CRISPR-associated protein Cse2 family [Gemmataceae bacterium]